MKNKYSFDDETIEKFQELSSKLYNLKYCLEMYMNYIEGETNIPLGVLCLGIIIKNYFNLAKVEFNKLEDELGILA